ncbi:hypothetical protein FA15DRAFT_660641 [Coprinopsis marcescibilis]|uniref:Uncharacterized protein n=1 Tax=Coprinopsis marcescibilis TaxID=230819 RepID=A0A5C3KF40_COPMA|nr:hypothetical protein FA15DRAFT_660641 [Coprinopsis marcescibilis]
MSFIESCCFEAYEGPARGVYSVYATYGVVECVFVVDEWGKGTGSLGEVKEVRKGLAVSDSLPIVRVEGAVVLPGLRILLGVYWSISEQIPLEGLRIIEERSDPDIDILSDEGGGWGWDREAFEGDKMPAAVRITLSNIYPFPSILFVLALTNSHNNISEQIPLEGLRTIKGCLQPDLASHTVLANLQHATWVSQAILDANGPYPAEVDGVLSCGMRKGVIQVQRKRFTNTVRDALSFGLTSLNDAGFSPISLDFFT